MQNYGIIQCLFFFFKQNITWKGGLLARWHKKYHDWRLKPFVDLGISDHFKAMPESIIFWKHMFALINHKIFMKII